MSMKRGMWEQELPQAPEDVHERILKTLADLDKQTTVASVEKGGNLMKKNNGERKNMVKWAVAAVAGVAVCMTTAAAGYFRWNEQAAKTFGNPSEEWQEETIKSKIAEPQDVSVSADGITITAVQSIRDTGRIYLLFRITADDDKIDWKEGFRSFEVTTVDGEALNGDADTVYNYGYNAGIDSFVDLDAAGKKDTYYFIDLISENPEKAWNGDKMAVTFRGFQYYTFGPDGKEGMEPTDGGLHEWKGLREIDGTWRLEIPMERAENRRQTFDIHRDVEIYGVPVEIKEVRISPLWLEVVYDRKDVEHLYKTVTCVQKEDIGDGLFPQILLDREGNLLMEYPNGGGPAETDNPDEMVYRMATGSVVDVDKVSAVILGGQQPTIVPLAEESELAEGEMQRYQETLDRLLEKYR